MPPPQCVSTIFDQTIAPILKLFQPLLDVVVYLIIRVDRFFHRNTNSFSAASTKPNNDDAPASNANWTPLPADYEQSTAAKKLDVLWTLIKQTEYDQLPGWSGMFTNRPLEKVRGFLTMDKSFDNFSDIMPEGRAKFVHPYGVVSRIEFKPVTNEAKFTGLFETGAIGVIRLSLASDPRVPVPGYSPGFGLKLLRDGMPSTNTVGFWTLDGNRSNADFFVNPHRTWLPWPKHIIVQTLALAFSLAEPRANILPVRDFALYDSNGNEVKNPAWPNVLLFEPDERLKNFIPSKTDGDIRQYLLKIEPGRLYKVYAQNDMDDANRIYVADVNVLADNDGRAFIASSFGDAHLFFRHQRKQPKRPEK